MNPQLLVLSSLFPSAAQPGAGLFIRERMFRVGRVLSLSVVSPQPWSPFDALIRIFRPHFRPQSLAHERQEGFDVYFPRYFSLPGLCKWLDGWFMALGCRRLLRQLRERPGFDCIDAHFAYPDGDAATLLGRWLGVPVTITLRGTEPRHARSYWLCARLRAALARAARIFSVSESLLEVPRALGISEGKSQVVGNAVDSARFYPEDRAAARVALGIAADAQVLISVGGLVERKGFHRVIELLPELRRTHPGLVYLIAGGASAEGDLRPRLEAQAAALGLGEMVRFLGVLDVDALRRACSAADVFVLATRNEGWANVFLEAMACGLPVVTTRVGGNAEVVCDEALGLLTPFGDPVALAQAIHAALQRDWDRARIVAHARANGWDARVAVLVEHFRALTGFSSMHEVPPAFTPLPLSGEGQGRGRT
jgi:glycosyltransferase involved in cell wall biosynthesis